MAASLITTADVTSVLGPTSPEEIGEKTFNIENYRKIVPKILEYGVLLPKTHVVPTGKFQQVYALSDIHADFRKFVQVLKQFGLVSTELNPYTNDIYSPELVGEARWTAPASTLLVIVGDLVDGKRNHGAFWNSSDDIEGAFEFRLHALIYNLRIQARLQHSDVLITIGNHDYETVIMDPFVQTFVDKYVHESAQLFFGEDRREALLPFYLINPYFFISIEGENREVAFVHGGLHSNVKNLLEKLVDYQRIVDRTSQGKLASVLNDYMNFTNNWVYLDPVDNTNQIGFGSANGDALWNRTYAIEDSCAIAKTSRYHYIIVGHCPTNYGASHPRVMGLVSARPECDNSYVKKEKDVGCVIMDCLHDKTKIAFVDTGLSKAQRMPTDFIRTQVQGYSEVDNEHRPVEILKLVHDSDDSDSYYNKALTIHVNSAGSLVEKLYYVDTSTKAPVNLVANFVGGKRVKRNRNRNTIKRKLQRKNRRTHKK